MKEKLGYLEGGSEVLLIAMQKRIEELGGEIKLSTPVGKLVIENGAFSGVESSGKIEKFDSVFCTVPLPYISRLIPDLPETLKAQYDERRNIAVVCLIVKLKKAVTKNFWLNVNDERMDIPGIVEYTNLYPMDDHIVYVPYYMPGEHPKYADSDDVFKAKVRSHLKLINPELVDSDFIEIHASRYRFAQPICDPDYLSKLPPVELPVKGMYVADTSYYYPEDRGVSESIRFGIDMAIMQGKA
jgi:protoporphyrinogen oxidase